MKDDIRIEDVSVSRWHSIFRLRKTKVGEEIWLQDNNSKYGTLTSQTMPYKLALDQEYYFQVGWVLVMAITEQPCMWVCSCILNPSEIEKGIAYEVNHEIFPRAYQFLSPELADGAKLESEAMRQQILSESKDDTSRITYAEPPPSKIEHTKKPNEQLCISGHTTSGELAFTANRIWPSNSAQFK